MRTNVTEVETMYDAIYVSQYYFDAAEIERRKSGMGVVGDEKRAAAYIEKEVLEVSEYLRGFFSSETQAGSLAIKRMLELNMDEFDVRNFLNMHIMDADRMKEELLKYYDIEGDYYNKLLLKSYSAALKMSIIWIMENFKKATEILHSYLNNMYGTIFDYRNKINSEIEKTRKKCKNSRVINDIATDHGACITGREFCVTIFDEHTIKIPGSANLDIRYIICGRISEATNKVAITESITAESVVSVLKGNKNVDIINLLKKNGSDMTKGKIAMSLGIASSNVTDPLNCLEDYEVVKITEIGKIKYYRINPEFFRTAHKLLSEFFLNYYV